MKEQLVYVDRQNTGSVKWDGMKEKYGRDDLLCLWVADMDFKSPRCVQDALQKQIDCGAYGYSILGADFTDAFVDWEQHHHGYTVQKEWVRYAPGVVSALYWCVSSMTDAGDAVMALPPVYYPFFHAIEETGRKLVLSPLTYKADGRYTPDLKDMEEKILNEHVKMLIFCSPHNPVGRVWTHEELEAVAELCARYNVILIADEIHQDFVYADNVQIPLGTVASGRVVTLTSPSKTFNLAGLQNAAAVLPDGELRAKWDAYTQRISVTNGSSLGYAAGTAAYREGAPWLEALKEQIYGNYLCLRDTLLKVLPKLQVAPLEGTYLMWIDFGAYVKPEEMQNFFENRCRIAIDYGDWFKGEANTFARFNLATSRERIEEAARRILAALA